MKTVTKKRTLLIISTLFAAVLGGAVLAGCTNRGGTTLEDVEEGGFTCAVTFDTAGGNWATGAIGGGSTSGEDGEQEAEETTRMEERQMYLKPGSTLDKKTTEDFAKTVREGYTFNTYYTGTKDANGNVTYGERWDYTKPVTESMTLYARWMENYTLVAHYGSKADWEKAEKSEGGIKGIPSKTFTIPQDSEGIAQSITSMNFTQEDVTVLAMYEIEKDTYELATEFTVSNTSPYTAPCTPENRVHHIYVETLDGVWTIVRQKKDFNIYDNNQLYLLIDIDYEGEVIDFPTVFKGKIYGNNHTVSNFKVEQTIANRNDKNFGLFKDIQDSDGKGAEIRDITFGNVKFTAVMSNTQVMDGYNAGVLAGRVTENTVIENVTVTGTFQFAITNKGLTAGQSFFEETTVDGAIGGIAGSATLDMNKYHVNIDGATAYKYEYEKIYDEKKYEVVFPEPTPPTGEEDGIGVGQGSEE